MQLARAYAPRGSRREQQLSTAEISSESSGSSGSTGYRTQRRSRKAESGGKAGRVLARECEHGIGTQSSSPQRNTSYINNPEFQRNNAGRSRPNEYKEHHQAYMVFVTESTDKHSLKRRSLEVNATMPAVPNWMEWSDVPIIWNCKDQPGIMPNPGIGRAHV